MPAGVISTVRPSTLIELADTSDLSSRPSARAMASIMLLIMLGSVQTWLGDADDPSTTVTALGGVAIEGKGTDDGAIDDDGLGVGVETDVSVPVAVGEVVAGELAEAEGVVVKVGVAVKVSSCTCV